MLRFDSLKGLFDKVFFRQAVPAIRLAQSRPLEEMDLPELPSDGEPRDVPPALYEVSVESGIALLLGIAKVLRKRLAISMLLAMLYGTTILLGPVLVYVLVDFVREAAAGRMDSTRGVIAGLLLCFSSGITGLLQHHYFYNCLKITQTTVACLNMRIFRQGLLLTRKSRMNRQTGDIVNLLGSDTDILSFAQFEVTELIMRCFVIIGAAAMLVSLLGVAGLIGLAALVLISPLAKHVAKNYLKLDDEIMAHRDKRVSLMSSLLSGIRIVKYFAWEKDMQREVSVIRNKEIAARRRVFNNTGASTFIYFSGSLLVGTVSFLVAIAMGRELDTPTLFASLALFGILEGTIGVLSELISITASGKVGADRIASFLRDPTFAQKLIDDSDSSPDLELKDFSARYEDSTGAVLSNLDLSVKAGESVAVIGPVGAGKTSLLLALLGEMPKSGGELTWTNLSEQETPSIAYVPQEATIINGSLRENIELGIDPDDELLAKAVRAAALDQDIAALSGGLSAEIGEQGINLSGGQKQRVNLARAARRSASVILLDDPISAVDFSTEKRIMDELIFGLWKDKTRIVVTHRLQHLKRFDRILFLLDGKIVGNGSFAELSEHNAAFRIFRQRSEAEHGAVSHAETEISKQAPSSPEYVRITDEEQRSQGSVGLSVYKMYAKELLGKKVALSAAIILVMSFLAVGTPVLQQSWLAYWSDHKQDFAFSMSGAVVIWSSLGLLSLIFAVMFQRMWLLRAQRAGQSLHDGALEALMKSPLNYFDRTPIGRILNRFSRDMDALEREIAQNLERTIGPILHTLAAVTILTFTVPLLGLIVIPAFFAYYVLQGRYRAASRDSQRLTSIARSPRFAFFKESMQAAPLIRAHGQVDVFLDRYEALLRAYQKSWHGSVIFNRWFSSRIPMLGAAITFGLISAILWLSQSGSLSAGAAGLSLVYALRLCDHLNNAIRSFTVVESNMIGVERLTEIKNLPAEMQPSFGALSPKMEWPIEGHIKFEKISVRYAPHLPLVLKDCDFEIKARQKVGIIGRTGAGKSTLFQVLYRFIAPTDGRVLIDGVDAATIPLERLRRAFAIIPQDPILFPGTLRSNLDRFAAYSDEKVWAALRRSHLELWVRSLPDGLATEIKENGSNFSLGQRQQLCLARALLLDTKIIVLDEATASVDVVTDGLIQETLRDECKDKTVLIIAHRLETLSLCDRVLEMRDGSPHFIR